MSCLGDDHLILRGGGGGGAGTFGRDRLFIFITGSAGKFISELIEEYLFSSATNFFKSQKNKQTKGGGGC